MQSIALSRDELLKMAEEDVDFIGLNLNRFASIFLAQFFTLKYGRILTTGNITNEIKILESLSPNSKSRTKPASKLTRNPQLQGLWHKHFSDAQFYIKNFGAHFGYESGGNHRLDQVISEAFKRNTSGYVDDEFCVFLANQLTIEAYKERCENQKLTGEWIVFQKHNQKNYYLAIGLHGDDEKIIHDVRLAVEMDFPFLESTFGV